jgi:plasmid stability protein
VLRNATKNGILFVKGVCMATLHVRSVPEDLYQEIQKLAEERSRSLSAQVVTMLAQALDDEKSRKTQTKALASIRRRRFSAPKKSPSSLELLHEDRKR